jgi:hypothetical protein
MMRIVDDDFVKMFSDCCRHNGKQESHNKKLKPDDIILPVTKQQQQSKWDAISLLEQQACDRTNTIIIIYDVHIVTILSRPVIKSAIRSVDCVVRASYSSWFYLFYWVFFTLSCNICIIGLLLH